jgi:hypothetical protein
MRAVYFILAKAPNVATTYVKRKEEVLMKKYSTAATHLEQNEELADCNGDESRYQENPKPVAYQQQLLAESNVCLQHQKQHL